MNDQLLFNTIFSRSKCATAKEELEKFHWTYMGLNQTGVITSWKRDKCYDEIMK